MSRVLIRDFSPAVHRHGGTSAVGQPGEEEQDEEAGDAQAADGVQRREEHSSGEAGAPAPAAPPAAAPPRDYQGGLWETQRAALWAWPGTPEHFRAFCIHICRVLQVEHYAWCGEFNENAATIIRQHAVQSGLSTTDETLAQWVEFCSVHMDHPLNFVLFAQLANKLQRPIAEGHLSTEEVYFFTLVLLVFYQTDKMTPFFVLR